MNYYYVLGITSRATTDELKLAYRKLAVRYHPDKNLGSSYAETRFKEITEAYRILSNPEKRARYDIMLAIQQQEKAAQVQQRTRYQGRPGPPPSSSYRTAWNTRENLLATAWALGIFLVIALLASGAYQYQEYRQAQAQIARQADAQRRLEQIEVLFNRKAYQEVLSHLQYLTDQGYRSAEATSIRAQSLQALLAAGQRAYLAQDYKPAAQHFQTYFDYTNAYDAEVLAKLVISYQQTKNYKAAVKVYKRVIEAEPRTVEARVGLAGIYAENLRDYNAALNYYQQASKLIENEYEALYGKAYPLAMNPASAPESHYTLHCGLAKVLISTGKLAPAENALKWAIFLRPKKPLAYYLMGLKHREARELDLACRAMQQASNYGYTKAAEYIPLLCKMPASSIATQQSVSYLGRTN